MDFLQLVLSRQSDRAYDKERPVEAESWSAFWKLLVWLLLPAMRSHGSLWS